MRYGVHVNSGAAVTDPRVLHDLGQMAEDLDYESILIGDHVTPPRKITTPFPLKLEHPPWQVYQEHPWPDCFVLLSFLAAATQQVRLGTSVIILPYRHPLVVAKMVATLDRLSGGRMICGVGIGWLREEFGFLGVPFAERAAMSEEYVAVMKAVWADPHPRYTGRYVTIDQDVNFGPLPVQQPHPPLWVGGNSPAALRRVARWGDGWQPVALSPPRIQQKLGQLRTLMDEAGRDFGQLEITTLTGVTVTVEEARAYQAAGIQTLYMLTTSDQPRELLAQVRQFAGTVRAVAER
jgi:probable F420-dependent oxidoreductase